MKKRILGSLILIAGLTLSVQTSLAAANNTSNGDNNGKPFQELNQLISENRNLVEANQAAINGLQADVQTINARISGIESDLASVAAQVNANTSDIGNAFAMIAAAEGDIEALRIDLTALAELHATDLLALQARLADIDGQIAALAAESQALAANLDARVSELRGLIDNNAIGIDAILADIVLINAQLTTINTQYNVLSSQQSTLASQLNGQAQQLANLETALNELKNRVNAYHDPCVEFITKGQTVTGELINDGECTADSRSYGGTHGARYYTFTIAAQSTVTVEMDGYQGWNSCSSAGTLSDPYLFLHSGGRDGSVITYNDDSSRSCGGTFNSRITRTLAPGTYTIEATSYHYSQYGTFTLFVH